MELLTDVVSASRDLDRRREPYALATVVWTKGTSSGKAGDKALVTADGTLQGWVGGACAIGTVIRECRAAIEEGRPRVLLVGADELADADGSRVPRIGRPASCASEGSYEIFIEPVLPRPQLVIFGDAPVARTLGALARTVGFRVVVSSAAEPGQRPEAHRVVPKAELSDVVVDDRTWGVVATMGRWDGKALRAALGTGARFVGLVASRRRWVKLERELRADVSGDAREERLLQLDRFLVVRGPGYRGGRAYDFMALPVARGRDVLSAETQDLTGDGRAELLLRLRQENDFVEVASGVIRRDVLKLHRIGRRVRERRRALGVLRVAGDEHRDSQRDENRRQNEVNEWRKPKKSTDHV